MLKVDNNLFVRRTNFLYRIIVNNIRARKIKNFTQRDALFIRLLAAPSIFNAKLSPRNATASVRITGHRREPAWGGKNPENINRDAFVAVLDAQQDG